MKISELKKLLTAAMRNKMRVLVASIPGAGKTEAYHQVAADLGCNLWLSHPAVADPTDYKGQPMAWKKGSEMVADFLPYGDLRQLIDAKEPTMAVFDDIGQAPGSVQNALMQLIQQRRINDHRISDHVVFFGATNRRRDKAGVVGLHTAIRSRFDTYVEVDVDHEEWCQWAFQNNMPPELIAFIRFRPAMICNFDPSKGTEEDSWACPRTVAAVGRWVNAGVTSLDVLSGAAGKGFATEFLSYLKTYRSMPNLDAIILNPEAAEVPSEPAIMWAVCSGLAHKASPQNFESICRYIERLPADFSVMTVKDATLKDKKILTTKAFMQWTTKNYQVLV